MDKQPREIRDPVHGFIERSNQEQGLIDTPVFQRLRGIKQLALANLVYPGALHTRFDHSIGVMHVAGRMAEQLEVIKEDKKIVRLAALLHDIGHGPFSHVSEDLLEKYHDKSRINTKSKEKIHERLTCDIINTNKEFTNDLHANERKTIVNLISGDNQEPIVRSIVSGPLDADKLDYLLRDSYFCGVKYGVFDIERLIGTLIPHKDKKGDCSLAATHDGLYAIEQFILAKYHLTMQVYKHKIRLITDAMIVRALEIGIERDKLKWLINLYRYDGTQKHLNNYLQWDDGKVINAILGSKRSQAKEIFLRLKERRLFKRLYSRQAQGIQDAGARDFLVGINGEPQFKAKLEAIIAEAVSQIMKTPILPEHVILTAFSVKSVREQSRNDESSIIVMNDDEPRKFEDESALFKSIDEKQKEHFVEVYAPAVYDGVKDKREKMTKIDKTIHEILVRETAKELKKRRKRENNKRSSSSDKKRKEGMR